MSELQSFIKDCLHDPWEGTNHQGYVFLTPKQKGQYGELFVEHLMTEMLCDVQPAETSTAGYDRYVDGIKTEIKFSLATRKNKKVIDNSFIINHVSAGKDWDRLIFCGVNTDNLVAVYMTKDSFNQELSRPDTVFHHQQGGKGIANDDYMCTDIVTLINRPYVHKITEW